MLLFTMLLACADPTEGRPAAQVVEAPATKPADKPAEAAAPAGDAKPAEAAAPAAAPAPIEGRTATVDGKAMKLEGSIGFLGAKLTKNHEGTFGEWGGEVTVAQGTPTSLKFTVKPLSVNTGMEKLDEHLRSADFFDATQFPNAHFVSTAIVQKQGAAGENIEVEGDLTIRGVTKRLRFPATFAADKNTATAAFVINRQDFGIAYPGKPDDLIKDEVQLKINLTLSPA